jgi:serine/threonine-protein kinase
VPTVIGEFILLNKKLAGALLGAGVLWLLYIALEPYVRRRWPHRIISWTRLLAGDVRNPLVGRDLLIGVLCGVVRCLQLDVRAMLWQGLGWPSVPLLGPAAYWLDALRDTGGLANQMIGNQGVMIISVLVTLFLLVLLSILLQKDWLAVGALWVFGAVASDLVTSNSTMNSFYGAMDLLNGAVNAGLFIFLLIRFGLLASVVGHIFFLFFRYLPITSDLSHWYAGGSTAILLAAAAVAVYGFWTSLAGQSVLQGRLLED